MKLTIDNLQGQGPQDYTAALDGTKLPKVERKGNQPAELQFSLVANSPQFVIPVVGAEGRAGQDEWQRCVHGVVVGSTTIRVSGMGRARGRYTDTMWRRRATKRVAKSESAANRPPFVNGAAGNALRQLAQDLLPGEFRHERGAGLDTLAVYAVNPQHNFSFHAAELAPGNREAAFDA